MNALSVVLLLALAFVFAGEGLYFFAFICVVIIVAITMTDKPAKTGLPAAAKLDAAKYDHPGNAGSYVQPVQHAGESAATVVSWPFQIIRRLWKGK